MIIAGIDPGKTGALAILFPDNSVIALRVPVMKHRGKPRAALVEWEQEWADALDLAEPDMFVIEDVAARPGQGVTSMFTFGVTLGYARGLIARYRKPVHPVTPTVWKGKMGLLKSDKAASREEARRLMPSLAPELMRVKDDGVAEAALLAYYGRKFLQ